MAPIAPKVNGTALMATQAKVPELKDKAQFAHSDYHSAEEAACRTPLPQSDHSSEGDPEPSAEPAVPGRRILIPAFDGIEYQMFIPSGWKDCIR